MFLIAGSYYYVESLGRDDTTYADLETILLEPSEPGRTLSFYWSMHGAAVNRLQVIFGMNRIKWLDVKKF